MNVWLLSALLPLAPAAPPSPPTVAAPVLHLRIVSEPGVQVGFHPGTPLIRSFAAPVQVGVRPGYIYRFQLSKLPEDPNVVLYPSLEIRGGLVLPINLKAEDFPATILLTRDDIRRAVDGGFVTKVIYLENPDLAPPTPTSLDRPYEEDVIRGLDPLAEARQRGRPLVVVRLGGREMTPDELAAFDVPGTLQLPGEGLLATPGRPPMLPAVHFPIYDPRIGPKPAVEELLADGGDTGRRVGIGPDGKIGGLDVSDTAMEFRYGNSERRTVVSNRICLFAPRFSVLRSETTPSGYHLVHGPSDTRSTWSSSLARTRQPSAPITAIVAPASTHVRESVRGIHTRVGPHGLDIQRGGALVLGTLSGVTVRSGIVEAQSATQTLDHCKPDQPLVLVKSADPREAQPGDVVTFTLRYINYGNRPIRDVAVVDSLASRLEYVAGSSQADRHAIFTSEPNEAGSAILRWEISGDLLPGQSGVIQFKVKVK